MSILCTADIHLNDNLRDAYRHDFMRNILPSLIKEHKPGCLVIAGDLTDEKDRHRSWLVNEMILHLVTLASLCHVILLKGNHDRVQEDMPFFQFTQHLDNVSWINSPTVYHDCIFLPHTTNYKRDWEGFEFKTFKGWVFAHNTFEGANLGGRITDTGIPTNIFGKGCHVISGDIHVPQSFDCITYVGSPYTIDFGDDFEPRCLLLNDDFSKRSISYYGPQKCLLETPYHILPVAWRGQHGDILKIRVSIPLAKYSEWPKIKEGFMNWAQSNGYIVNSIIPIVEGGEVKKMHQKSIRKTMSDEEIYNSYVKARSLDDSTKQIGTQLLRRV